MPFQEQDNLRYYTFSSLDLPGITHAVFTRHGGVSPAPWQELNVGGLVGDETQRVIENRRRSFAAAGKPFESIYDVWQVHGTQVVCAQAPRPPDVPHVQADTILCNQPGVTLFMRFADCVPILLVDPHKAVVGLVHAGWQGTILRAAAAAIQAMQHKYGSNPADLLAAIGPSIGVHHYPVGPEVVARAQQAFPEWEDQVLVRMDDQPGNGQVNSGVQFDMWAANRLVLNESGVGQIEVAGICTACHPEDWYSHRGEKGRTGRFGVLIGLD